MKTKKSSFGKVFFKPFCFAKAFTENTSWKKRFALVKIAIVLCSVFLVALPGIAADQTTQKTITTASADEFTLGIFGNANEDDTIDMRDTTYIKLVIFGKKPKTDLADANNDGKVSMLDVGQTKLIILGKEKKLTLIDSVDRVVTVEKPVNTIIPLYHGQLPPIRALGARDKVIGVGHYATTKPNWYPDLSKLPDCGNIYAGVNYERIFELKPDIVILRTTKPADEATQTIESASITVVRLRVYDPELLVDGVKKLGYILDKESVAERYLDFRQDCLDTISERIKGLSEEDKPRVFFETGLDGDYGTASKNSFWGRIPPAAGGINIAADLPGEHFNVDPEWVIEQNPDIIVYIVRGYTGIASGYDTNDPSEMSTLRADIMNRHGWGNIDAVKNGNVYLFDFDLFMSHYFIGIGYLAKAFYPKLFEDLDPKAIHQEWLTQFQGLDFNVYEHGVFVYPPIE